MSRRAEELTPLLQEVWKDIREWYAVAYPNSRELFLTCTHRCVEEQKKLYEQGRTKPGKIVTNCDGYNNLSKHNHMPARAFDFGVKEHGMVRWADELFLPIGRAIEESKYRDKVRWGGTFKSPKDYPHIEEI